MYAYLQSKENLKDRKFNVNDIGKISIVSIFSQLSQSLVSLSWRHQWPPNSILTDLSNNIVTNYGNKYENEMLDSVKLTWARQGIKQPNIANLARMFFIRWSDKYRYCSFFEAESLLNQVSVKDIFRNFFLMKWNTKLQTTRFSSSSFELHSHFSPSDLSTFEVFKSIQSLK